MLEGTRPTYFIVAVCCLMLACSLAFPPALAAQECLKASPTDKPCVGVIMPTEMAKACVTCTHVTVPSLQLELGRQTDFLKLCNEESHQKQAACTAQLQDLIQQIVNCTEGCQPTELWYKSPWIWTPVGIVIGSGATVLILRVVGKL